MLYRKSSSTGLSVSSFGLGTHFTIGDRLSIKKSKMILQEALSIGINLIDTANTYAEGECEKLLGQLLKSVHRSQYLLATKLFFPIFDGPNGNGLSRKHIIESTNQSLDRLNVDYIDVLQMHRYDPDTPIEEVVETIKDLRSQGKILYWGVSQWNGQQLKSAIDLGEKPIWNQLPFNYFYRKNLNLISDMSNLDVDFLGYGSLAQGVINETYLNANQNKSSRLFHPQASQSLYHNTPTSLETLKKLSEHCNKRGISLFEFSIGYCELECKPISTLIGSYRPIHFENMRNYITKRSNLIMHVKDIIDELNQPKKS